jgi:hypothetical protein
MRDEIKVQEVRNINHELTLEKRLQGREMGREQR